MPILLTVESGHLWGILSPFLIPMGLTFVLALILFYIAMRMTPGKKQRTFSIITLIVIPVSLIVFLYISLSTR
ncbi:hypothetical protein DHX103_11435 [Planococcus sp. X10-3]|uniref:hypothetical protein n=1 Tax=Planococcus sp. X10-3 TaxID=3061240 RepID=UPI003BAE33E1